MDQPYAYRIDRVADLLSISRSKAYELIKRGELPPITVGRVLRVPRVGLEDWIAAQQGGGAAPSRGGG